MILAKENHQHYYQQYEPAQKPGKVRKVRRYKNSSRVLYAGVLLLAFATFLLLATRYAQITATGYEIVDMKKQLKIMQNENQALEMKIAKLQSLERIEAVAVGKLGMVKPNTSEGVQFVAVETNGTLANQELPKGSVNGAASKGNKSQKPMAVIDALSKLLANWSGKVAQAEAGTVID